MTVLVVSAFTLTDLRSEIKTTQFYKVTEEVKCKRVKSKDGVPLFKYLGKEVYFNIREGAEDIKVGEIFIGKKFSIIINDKIKVSRFLFLNEEEFSDEDVKALKEAYSKLSKSQRETLEQSSQTMEKQFVEALLKQKVHFSLLETKGEE